jgi:hypothetical protein
MVPVTTRTLLTERICFLPSDQSDGFDSDHVRISRQSMPPPHGRPHERAKDVPAGGLPINADVLRYDAELARANAGGAALSRKVASSSLFRLLRTVQKPEQ